MDTDDRTFRHVFMRRDNLLHLSSRQTVASDIDHIVHAAHDEDVAVLIDVPAVACEVIAGERLEVGFDKPLVRLPQRRKRTGGKGKLDSDRPSCFGPSSFPVLSRILILNPGTGFVDEPGFIGKVSMPRGFAVIGQPVSVCHQWSITGFFRRSWAQW